MPVKHTVQNNSDAVLQPSPCPTQIYVFTRIKVNLAYNKSLSVSSVDTCATVVIHAFPLSILMNGFPPNPRRFPLSTFMNGFPPNPRCFRCPSLWMAFRPTPDVSPVHLYEWLSAQPQTFPPVHLYEWLSVQPQTFPPVHLYDRFSVQPQTKFIPHLSCPFLQRRSMYSLYSNHSDTNTRQLKTVFLSLVAHLV